MQLGTADLMSHLINKMSHSEWPEPGSASKFSIWLQMDTSTVLLHWLQITALNVLIPCSLEDSSHDTPAKANLASRGFVYLILAFSEGTNAKLLYIFLVILSYYMHV